MFSSRRSGCRGHSRFEACLPLQEWADGDTNPLEAGLTPFVKLYKPSFRGKENLTRVKHEGLKRRLVGLEVTGRGIPRQGYPVLHGSEVVGKITSGTYAPTLDKNLGLAYVAVDYSEPGTDLFI